MIVKAKNLFKCLCQHEYQDRKYGKGIRVWTPVKTPQGQPQIKRCTVCKREE